MPCGSDNIIIISQFTPDGDYQESTDGGATYHDAPDRDPRNAVTLPPPFLPPGTVEAECTYADSVVNIFLNEWINATGDGEDLATVIAGILTFLAGLLGAIGAVVAVILLAIAASVVEGTVTAWKAAFTSDVWDRFRCNLHNNMQSDGSFTAADIDAIYEQLAVDETGLVLISLQQAVAAAGWQGMTVASRAGRGSPTAECCVEEGCATDWVVLYGTETARTSTTIDVTAVFNGADSKYHAQVQSPGADMDICCTIDFNDTISGLDWAYFHCGSADPTFSEAVPGNGWWLDTASGNPFSLQFVFS